MHRSSVGIPDACGLVPPFPFVVATLSAKNEVHSLGVLVDPALSMDTQIVSVVCSACFHLSQIVQLHRYLDTGSLTTLVHALVVEMGTK